MKIDQKKLKELFDYRQDGTLTWRVRMANCLQIGDIAGRRHVKAGYHEIKIDGKLYRRSRLVYCWHHGYFPENDVDHINRLRHDDRVENLREVARQCNNRNCKIRRDNSSGIKGVSWEKTQKKWKAHIAVDKKTYTLGRYKSLANAACARLAAEQCLSWGGCDSTSPAYQYVKEHVQ
jgi:hypothetical protein